LETLWWLVTEIFSIAWLVLSWVISKLFWLSMWVLLPVVMIAMVGLRAAEYFLGKENVRSWVKKHSLRLGKATWLRSRRALFALGAMPLRVIGWLMLYTLWHSILSLWWTPRWSPWQRAWARRWRRRRPA
jgi:hypothetical protein